MSCISDPNALSKMVNDLENTARTLFDASADFPALNRNLKRIMASIDMVKLNLEGIEDHDARQPDLHRTCG
jgi:hypothetical protein